MVIAAGPALAQLAPPRTLDELKQEIQARADRRAYPVSQLDPAEVREALANLKSQERDRRPPSRESQIARGNRQKRGGESL
jgi:hypothetical protein